MGQEELRQVKKRKQMSMFDSTDVYVESGQKRTKSSWPGLRTGEGQVTFQAFLWNPGRGTAATTGCEDSSMCPLRASWE